MSDGATRFALVWCPCASREEARRLAHALVAERLVACANILGPMLSVFAWQGNCEESEEHGLLCKTSPERMPEAIDRLAALHGYETPAIVGWIADESTPQALQWLAGSL